jgi:DNA-directed RNA polymerase alpha subunit
MSTWSDEQKQAYAERERLATPIAELKLSVRIINTLEEHDVILVEHLLDQTYDTLMGMKNFGEKTLTEVRAALRTLGVTPPDWKRPPKVRVPKPKKSSKDFMSGGGFW